MTGKRSYHGGVNKLLYSCSIEAKNQFSKDKFNFFNFSHLF